MYLPPELAVVGVLTALFVGTLSCGRKLAASVALTVSWAIWCVALAPFEHWYNAVGAVGLDATVAFALFIGIGVGSVWRALLVGLLCAQVFCHLGYITLALSPITEREFGRAFFAYMHVLDALFIAQLCCIIVPGAWDVLGSLFHRPGNAGTGRAVGDIGNLPASKGAQGQ